MLKTYNLLADRCFLEIMFRPCVRALPCWIIAFFIHLDNRELSVATPRKQQIKTSKEVWDLMVNDFYWSSEALDKLRVRIRPRDGGALPKEVKLQPFEVIVAAVFARLRPDYDWWVTPNHPDHGIDFVGQGAFLTSKELGIAAAITVGGQCKKRGPGSNAVKELSGSFVDMDYQLHPTFFVAAFAAPVNPKLLAAAKERLESSFKRHCHILDRHQLENLIGANLVVANPVIRKAFGRRDAEKVLDYFRQCSDAMAPSSIGVASPTSVLAGESFRIRLQITRNSLSETSFRLKWKPNSKQQSAALVSPVGADSRDGVVLDCSRCGEDPLVVEQDLEFVSYAVGRQGLGTVAVHPTRRQAEPLTIKSLPDVEVVENLKPPFYDVPYRQALDEIERGMASARAGKVTSVAVIGAGGAGKTRLCEEVCLEAKRRGAYVVSARQAHSIEFPRRILANLLLGLTDTATSTKSASKQIDEILGKLEPKLAKRASPIIEALCDNTGKLGSFEDDQPLLSAVAVLIAQKCRSRPAIIHLHDLHWCTRDVLDLIERLLWQLDHLKVQPAPHAAPTGIRVLFLLEGRMHEHREGSETGWSTQMFERFIERLACPIAKCRAFNPRESAAFATRLFEQTYTANRMLSKAFPELQRELIERINQVAGGNPFHMLEQVKLLQQHGVIAQNPQTGFMYMIQPEFREVALPATVFETIEARWRYYWVNDRELAVLLWAVALMEDSLPRPLFDHLWRRIAPGVTQQRLESTEFLTLSPDEGGSQVSFRHENYFQTVRQIQIPQQQRDAVVDAYASWFAKTKQPTAALRYVQARVALEARNPDLALVKRLLRAAEVIAVKRKDRSLTSRILATLLDRITWPSHQRRSLTIKSLVQACDDEISLCKNLSRSGQTDIADKRIQHLLEIIDAMVRSHSECENVAIDRLIRRRFILLAMQGRLRYRDRQPVEAASITAMAIQDLNAHLVSMRRNEREKWNEVIMEVRHAHSVTIALAGDIRQALTESREAARIAQTQLTKSAHAIDVIITYANILLSEAPNESESILQHYQDFAKRKRIADETRLRLDLNISMARMIIGYREERCAKGTGTSRLETANKTLLQVFRQAHPLGRLGEAAAAALLLGLISALQGKADDIDWFAQSIALAIRGRQLEILWRAHLNLAHSLHRSGRSPHDPATAALDIMIYSLSAFANADQSPRFNLLSVPMAHAVRYLILSGDQKAENVFRKFPLLRRMFTRLNTGQMKDNRDGRASHEWLRIGEADYVIY
jgi:AAA ATPase domain